MVEYVPSSEKTVNRKIKTHSKSRQGCGNCKIRKVKCDEGRPKCKQCRAFRVLCNYDRKARDLQLCLDTTSASATQDEASYWSKESGTNIMPPVLRKQTIGSLASDALNGLRQEDLELLDRFQARTIPTICFEQSLNIYQNELVKLACLNPFLMHTLLTLTLMQDRYLSTTPNSSLSTKEAFHWCKSIALFNERLSGNVLPSERDALWATTIFMGMIVFCFVDAETPEQAWPLKLSSSMDLNWLKVTDGKKSIWNITQPLRQDSIWRPLLLQNMRMQSLPAPSAIPGLEALPLEIIKLCAFDAESNTANNSYYGAAASLARSLHSDCVMSTVLHFMFFIGDLEPGYTQLLERKDPCALLLLAYWYAKVAKICNYQLWWLRPRVTVECRAICIYLERYCPCDVDIQRSLLYPRIMCGIVAA